MRIGWRAAIAFLVVTGTAMVLARTVFRPQALDVGTAPVSWGPVEDIVANSEAASVRSRAFARLGTERAGRVVAISVREGFTAKRGQILLRLDASTAEARLEQAAREQEAARATHEVTHAEAERTQQQYDRVARLHEQAVASQEEWETVKAQLRAANAELAASEARWAAANAAMRAAQDENRHHLVRAPFDGTVTRRYAEVGESVVPGQVVLELVALDRLYVSAPIDERDAARLRTELPARVTVDTYPGETWSGVVTRVGAVVDETKDLNRTIEVEVELVPGARLLRPGMTADVEIVLERRARVLRVPSIAVIDGRRVWTAERGRATSRAITTGLRNWEWTEVAAGLSAGQPVITTLDRAGLREGVRVVPKAGSPEGGTRADSASTASLP